MRKCINCDGTGKRHGYGCGPNVCLKPITLTCDLCNGTGEIGDERLDWVERGKAMRFERVHGGEYRNLRDEAKRRGISVVTLSKMECGIIEPDTLRKD